MEVLAKGQLSYMILSCLKERDMYGLELIEEMKVRYGREIKLPSLYSNLNRMKELKYISSYLKESTKGPKCSYSSITTAGREALNELENEFKELAVVKSVEKTIESEKQPIVQQTNIFDQALRENANIFTSADERKQPSDEIETEEETSIEQDIPDDYDDYFAFGDEESPAEPEDIGDQLDEEVENIEEFDEAENSEDSVSVEKIEEESTEDLVDNEFADNDSETEDVIEFKVDEEELNKVEASLIDENTEEISENKTAEKEENQEFFETSKEQISATEAGEYNQKIYAAAKDFSKNRNKRSYSENQIALALNTAPSRTEENKQQSLSQLKEALINSRQGHYEGLEERFATKPEQKEIQPIVPTTKTVSDEEEKKDDGVFITDRIDESELPKPKKIEPARLNVSLPTAQGYDSKLPAPKRNVAVDPTCKDVKAKLESLYAKAEVKKEPVVESGDFDDYADLKRYYTAQEVEFKVYERAEKRPKHNTNKLKLFVSMFVFGLIGVGSALLYMIFALTGLTTPETNFVYYLFPIIAAVYVMMCFYNYKTTNSKIPSKMMHPAIVWTILAILIAIIFLLNYACGAAFDRVETYFSTILVPIYDCLCATIGIYYSQIYAYKKFWI